MAKIAILSVLLLTGLTTAAPAVSYGTHQGFNGRPHGNGTAERMLLRRSHTTRAQYNRERRAR